MAKYVDPEVKLARRSKKAGITRSEFLRIRTETIDKTAKDQGWRPSERAATLADVELATEKVYGVHKPLTSDDMDKALDVISRPEFWCRAKLFRALEAARQKGVLIECLDEMDVRHEAAHAIICHVEQHWKEKP